VSTQPAAQTPVTWADAVVVGAGPSGAAAAYHLARAGRDVIMLEKASFPRDKSCGDGLTPRAVQALRGLGMDKEAEGDAPGWARQEALHMHGGGVVLRLPWPQLPEFPAHSVTAPRTVFDEALARNAEQAGAQLWERHDAREPVYADAGHHRVGGVAYRSPDGDGVVRAPVVIAADGRASRFATQLGVGRDDDGPMGVAIRTYYRSAKPDADAMEGFLDLERDGEALPGYGWIFPLGDGLANVGWGLLNTSPQFRGVSYPKKLREWVATLPDEWGFGAETEVGPAKSSPLPMGHNRRPRSYKGALLVGDSAGMINPFNGEGISYGIEAGKMAAEAADLALATGRDAPLEAYDARVAQEWGGYYRVGRTFVDLIGHPRVMRAATDIGMPRRRLMQVVFRLMAHLIDDRPADTTDRILQTMARVAPRV